MAEMVKVRVNGQFDITLPKHRADRPEWFTEKGWEKEKMQNMRGRVDNGHTVLYVGAEEGDLAAIIASWGAKMILVEPNPKVWPNIKAIWDANNLEDPIGFFVGFASSECRESKELQSQSGYFLKWPSCSFGEIIGDHGFMELRNHNTAEVTINEFAGRLGQKIDHISIDVEGSEWEVLKGAEAILKIDRPILWVSIHPEFMIQQYGQYSADLRNWIKDRGYKETLLAYDHEIHMMYTPL